MKMFLSCDWGTTSFRLRLVSSGDLSVLAEETSDQGIAMTYGKWQREGTERELFYAAVLQEALQKLSRKVSTPLHEVPVVLSGMASASIGWHEMPYKTMPFRLDGSDLLTELLSLENMTNKVILISGVRTDHDVMRGEETKVAGCVAGLKDIRNESLLILPGTHPKHVLINRTSAYALRTYMTGELFDLLSTRSVLSASVTESSDREAAENRACFARGVEAGSAENLLHACFIVRTNQLLQQVPPTQNFYFLSGLLIGSELKDVDKTLPLYLVGSGMHNALYSDACRVLGIPVTQQIDANQALIAGQLQLLLRKNCL